MHTDKYIYVIHMSTWPATQISTDRKHTIHASTNNISDLIMFHSLAEQAEDPLVRHISIYFYIDIVSISV